MGTGKRDRYVSRPECSQCSNKGTTISLYGAALAISLVYVAKKVVTLEEFHTSLGKARLSSIFEERTPGIVTSDPANDVSGGAQTLNGEINQRRGIQVSSAYMPSCRGSFIASPEYTPIPRQGVGYNTTDTPEKPPAFMLREAIVDNRHNSLLEYRLKHNQSASTPFRRITLHVSAARGSRPLRPFPHDNDGQEDDLRIGSVALRGTPGWTATMDYILPDAPCVNRCFTVRNVKGLCSGHEWQLVISLRGPKHLKTEEQFQRALNSLTRSAENEISVVVPVFLPNKEQATEIEFTLALSCVTGLTIDSGVENLLRHVKKRAEHCYSASGSVVAAGGAMFGQKRNNQWYRREGAHFAARALLGQIRFDTVALGVITSHSVQEILDTCGLSNDTCARGFQSKNEKFMHDLASDLEDELEALGVPQSLWSRVILFPFCNLGTDYKGFEGYGEGCKWSAFYGQWISNDLSYTFLSPLHKWYASFDLDEFIGRDEDFTSISENSGSADPRKASAEFDRLEKSSPVPGILRARWLDFKMQRLERRNMTSEFLRNGGLNMVSLSTGSKEGLNKSSCLQQGNGGNGGKPIVSCNNGGFGVHVHLPLRLQSAKNLNSRECPGKRLPFESELALYHARGNPRFGDCQYAPGNLGDN